MSVAAPRLVAVLAAAAGMLVLPATAARAANGAGAPAVRTVTNFPHGYIEYSLAAGAEQADAIRVGDDGDTAATFNVLPVDGFTSDLSGVVYGDATNALHDGPRGNGEYGAGTWITLASSTLTLQPKQQTLLNYTVRVPAGIHPGDYVGAISAENPVPTGAAPSGQGAGINITQRSVIAVVVHVPGAVASPSFHVGTPTIAVENHRRQVITFPLVYNGDTLVKPHLAFDLVAADGRRLLHFDQQLDTFVPHTTIHFPFPVDNLTLAPGSYRLTGSFGDGAHTSSFDGNLQVTAEAASVPPADQRTGTATSAGHSPAWLAPALAAGGGFLLVALVALAVLWARRRCSHCSSRVLRALIHVEDFHEIADCESCRQRALDRHEVRLCQACYRSHVLARRESPAAPPRSRPASA
jgi:hypothetical protein